MSDFPSGIVRMAVTLLSKGEATLPLFTPSREGGAKYIELAGGTGVRLKTLHDVYWLFDEQDDPKTASEILDMKQNQVTSIPV
jgi:hypothetical protein